MNDSSHSPKKSKRKGGGHSHKKSKNIENIQPDITIENKEELYALPNKLLKDTKISNFKGKYFDFLYQKALELEQSNKKPFEMSNASFSSFLNTTSKISTKINSSPANKKKKKKSNTSHNKGEKSIQNMTNNIIINNFDEIQNDKKLLIKKIVFQMKYNTKVGEELLVIGSNLNLGGWNQNSALKLNWTSNNIWKASIPVEKGSEEDFEFKFILSNHGNLVWESGNNRKFIFEKITQLIQQCINSENISSNGFVYLNNINGQSYTYEIKNHELNIISEWNKK